MAEILPANISLVAQQREHRLWSQTWVQIPILYYIAMCSGTSYLAFLSLIFPISEGREMDDNVCPAYLTEWEEMRSWRWKHFANCKKLHILTIVQSFVVSPASYAVQYQVSETRKVAMNQSQRCSDLRLRAFKKCLQVYCKSESYLLFEIISLLPRTMCLV